jgi:hypothetical protein
MRTSSSGAALPSLGPMRCVDKLRISPISDHERSGRPASNAGVLLVSCQDLFGADGSWCRSVPFRSQSPCKMSPAVRAIPDRGTAQFTVVTRRLPTRARNLFEQRASSQASRLWRVQRSRRLWSLGMGLVDWISGIVLLGNFGLEYPQLTDPRVIVLESVEIVDFDNAVLVPGVDDEPFLSRSNTSRSNRIGRPIQTSRSHRKVSCPCVCGDRDVATLRWPHAKIMPVRMWRQRSRIRCSQVNAHTAIRKAATKRLKTESCFTDDLDQAIKS